MFGRRNYLITLLVLVSFLLGVTVTGGVLYLFKGVDFIKAATIDEIQQKTEPGLQVAPPSYTGLGPDTVAEMVEKVGPAVVKIDTMVKVKRSFNPFFDDPFFKEFFEPFYFDRPQTQIQRGIGSGFIFSKDGYILTNEHVINGADEIKVTVQGYEKPFKAKVVGSDYSLDLAVLKIDVPKELPFLKMGDSDKIRVGEWVVAIGNPYGLDHTVTVGVISAKGRPLSIQDRHYENLLQTDASINPGNSGGPLLNLKGEVIGINTAINAQAQGIGFAIPTNTVKGVLEQLIEEGKIRRPWLGVIIQDITPELAEYFELDSLDGAIISHVEPGSPADEAGLQRGDVILEIDKKQIKDADDVVEIIQNSKIGQKVVILINRFGKTRYVTVKIGEKPQSK